MSPGLKKAIIDMLMPAVLIYLQRCGASYVQLIPTAKGIQIYSDKVYGKRRTLFTDEELDAGVHKGQFDKRMCELLGVLNYDRSV